MAASAVAYGLVLEVRADGADTNGGGYDTADSGTTWGITDLQGTGCNGAAPEVWSTSGVYSFGAGDEYLYIATTTGNWLPGFYKIVSTNAGKATLNMACATSATPTGAKCAVDYSQQAAAKLTTTTATTSGTTLTWPSASFTKAMVGNLVYLSGAGVSTNWYQIRAVTDTSNVVLNSAPGNNAGGVTANLGGALQTIGAAGTAAVQATYCWVKGPSYTFTAPVTYAPAASSNLATRSFIHGYTTYRGDGGKVTLTASVGGWASNNYMLTVGNTCDVGNFIFEGSGITLLRGLSHPSEGICFRCTFQNLPSIGLQGAGACDVTECVFDTCATAPGPHILFTYGLVQRCLFKNTNNAVSSNYAVYTPVLKDNIFSNVRSQSVAIWTYDQGWAEGNTFYNIGGTGYIVRMYANQLKCRNNLFVDCPTATALTAWAPNSTDANVGWNAFYNCGATYGISSGISGITGEQLRGASTRNLDDTNVYCTVNPLVDPANGDFRLNAAPGGGAAVRNAMGLYNFAGLSVANYRGVGALQAVGIVPNRGCFSGGQL